MLYPCQVPTSEASTTSVDPIPSTTSLASTTSVTAPVGEACPPPPATKLAQFTSHLTSEDTCRLLQVLETYGDVPLKKVSVAHALLSSRGSVVPCPNTRAGDTG